ncbi:MAG: sigma-70 family RNA polymerase sigma factor [Planctomycetota bacterium]|nr:sigma-70 family RNA polymerase sigma factor [Planctomycetota bacterium]
MILDQAVGVTDRQDEPRDGEFLGKMGNFVFLPASNLMSSVSGAQFEAGLPPSGSEADARRNSAILRKAREGDRAAFGQIVELYQNRLFNALLRMVGDIEEARELTQETFTRGLSKIEGFRGESSPYTWLFRIGINLAISQMRKSQKRQTFSLDGASSDSGHAFASQASGLIDRLAAGGDSPPQAIERRERNTVVLAALSRMDSEYRAVLVMRDIEGFDYQQMAEVLGLPLGTLKSRLFRARLALRDELAPYLTDNKEPRKS